MVLSARPEEMTTPTGMVGGCFFCVVGWTRVVGCGLWEARLGRSRELAWRLLASEGL